MTVGRSGGGWSFLPRSGSSDVSDPLRPGAPVQSTHRAYRTPPYCYEKNIKTGQTVTQRLFQNRYGAFGNGHTMRWCRSRPGSCRRTGGPLPEARSGGTGSTASIGHHGSLRRVCDRLRRRLRGASDCRCVCRAGAPRTQPAPAQPAGRSAGPVSVNCGRMPVYSAGIRPRRMIAPKVRARAVEPRRTSQAPEYRRRKAR